MTACEHRFNQPMQQDAGRLLAASANLAAQQERLQMVKSMCQLMSTHVSETLDSVRVLEQQRSALLAMIESATSVRDQPKRKVEKGDTLEASPAVPPPATRPVAIRTQDAKQPVQYSVRVTSAEGVGDQPAADEVVTFMLRPIPRSGSPEMLVSLWPPNCPDCPYNMLYAPKRAKRSGLQGYAFINFTNAQAAARFRARWEGVQPPPMDDVSWSGPLVFTESEIQGLRENLKHFSDNSVDKLPPERWPLVFEQGMPTCFASVMADFHGTLHATIRI